MRNAHNTVYRERGILVCIADGRRNAPPPLEELASLAETAGVVIVGEVIQNREAPAPKYYIGSGKVTEVATQVADTRADVVIFDNDLTPAQTRSLEKEIGRRVLDRTELILDIFATHARTNQSKLQVELAQLEYSLPRLRAMGSHITSEQQAGGVGVGQRGPGEKQLESDRRLARDRITELKREMREIEKRKQREVTARRFDNLSVAVVGYTNAGKSTLMNSLTQAGVIAEDRLFSTLDTRTRLWKLKGGVKVLLSDTVGFIRNLPHGLVSSFHATLEEVLQADLLLHVIDASHPESDSQIAAVESVLKELGASDRETLKVFNKVDRFRDPVEMSILRNRHPGCVCISARSGEGLDELDKRVTESVSNRMEPMTVDIPIGEGKLLAEIAAHSQVISRKYGEESVRMKLRVPKRDVWKLAPYKVEPKTKSDKRGATSDERRPKAE